MERLTERTGEGLAIPRMDLRHNGHRKCMERLAEYEDTGVTPAQIREIDRLYAEKCKELAGRCKKMPCAVGDMTYWADNYQNKVRDFLVEKIEIDSEGVYVVTSGRVHPVNDFGKTVFLSREEAEAALGEFEKGGKEAICRT